MQLAHLSRKITLFLQSIKHFLVYFHNETPMLLIQGINKAPIDLKIAAYNYQELQNTSTSLIHQAGTQKFIRGSRNILIFTDDRPVAKRGH